MRRVLSIALPLHLSRQVTGEKCSTERALMTRPIAGLSHVKGSTNRSLIHATIPDFMAEIRRRYANRVAAVFCDTNERWTYDDLMNRVDRLAAGLLSIGVYKEDRVGIWSPQSIRMVTDPICYLKDWGYFSKY